MSALFLALVVLALAAVLFLGWRARLRPDDLEALLKRLQPLDTEALESESGLRELGTMYVLSENTEVLIRIAEHIQVHHPEALLVAELMRQSARQIAWYVARSEKAPAWEYGMTAVALYRDLVFKLEDFCRGVVPELGAELESRLWVSSAPAL